MAQRGVGGGLEVHHLNRIFFELGDGVSDDDPFRHSQYSCPCCWKQWKTCDECCFGFPIDHGIWMEDWTAHLEYAADAACQTAEQPLVWNLLEALRCGTALPFAISEEALVHLLDIAILTGNKEAAVLCAERSSLRPLRRWSFYGMFNTHRWDNSWYPLTRESDTEFERVLVRPEPAVTLEPAVCEMLLAALSTGVALQSLHTSLGMAPAILIPFRVALVLCRVPCGFADLVPSLTPVPSQENGRTADSSW
ncbi:unnamed protein product [Durusdinium trenchii]|uniref:Anaphase-promoting complex subunit 1 n=1 Tax=Durusdinium trenchii TaxID=1381693 RepID=A0ABP0I1I4_9DINO